MLTDARRFSIETAASRVLSDDGLNALPICPKGVAERRDITVVENNDAEAGVSGMLLRHADSFGIMYATHIPSDGFQRFSIAHELGHYFLDGHPERIFATENLHRSSAGFRAADPIEIEADFFAASLLMPRALFRAAAVKQKDGMRGVLGLSDLCRTSRLATAIRYAETTDTPTAVLVSRGNVVDYCFCSAAVRERRGLSWPKKGSLVPKESATFAFNQQLSKVANAEQDQDDSDFSVWFGGNKRHFLNEEVLGLGDFGRTLTVLTADDSEEEGDDDEDDVPRFR